MTGKRFGLWLCILALALGLLRIPAALALTLAGPRPDGESPTVSTYQVTLDAQVIGAGETLSYEVIAPEFAGNPAAADYYPGKLTVELAGQIVIEEGGCLAIGTLSLKDENEHSPVLRGRCLPEGLIVVRPGGSLILKNVSLQLEGEGSFVVQEPGGSVALTETELDDGLIVWAPPTVDNAHQQPRDLWLEEGTALTAAMLPSTLGTYLQYRGGERWETFALQWDMDPYEGQTEGEYTLTGAFLDEAGEALASVRPLTLTVHWYQPGRLVVTGATWLGQTAASAKLELKELPEEADEVWGEVSADGGKTWERWEEFQYQEEKHGVPCEFFLTDSVPRHFRVRAASEWDHLYWISEAVLLPKEGTEPTDQGGNRGGSTAVVRPSRTPSQPEPTPTPTPTPSPTPTPTPEPTPTPTPEPTTPPSPEPSAESVPTVEATPPAVAAMAPAVPATAAPKPTASVTAEPTPSPSPSAEPAPSAEPIPSAGPAPTAEPETTPEVTPPPAPTVADGQESPPPIAQIMLVAAGAVLCGGMGVYVARRKRK